MSQTIDNVVFERAQENEVSEKPFLKRDWIFITDSNNGNYSQNQVVFDSTSLSSNGKLVDYPEGVLSFPQVITVSSSDGAANFSTGLTYGMTDALIALKNSHYNIVHSCTIEYANGTVVEQKPYLNQYINFRLNTELSQMDEELFGSQIGYAKDSSEAYGYNITSAPQGLGLYNNVNPVNGLIPSGLAGAAEIGNSGFIKRTKYLEKVSINGKNSLLMSTDDAYMRATGANTIVNTAGNLKVYYYDCTIRLKDLSDFFAKMPLVRGAVIKITLVLNNNISFQVTKDALGNQVLVNNSFQNVSSLTNPLMFASSTVKYSGAVPTSAIVNGVGDVWVPCGSTAIIPASPVTFTVTSNLCTSSVNSNYKHVKTTCRLYVPVHILSGEYEKMYIANPQRNIEYTDIEYFWFKASAGQQFIQTLTNGTSRMKRLIIMTHLASSGAGNASEVAGAIHSPLSSPFWDGNVSPHIIQNFNVSLAGNNVYPNLLQYSYQQFWNEMNSQQGINGGLVNGLCSGRISLTDYQNNYKYYVVDLSRRLPADENVPQSVQISGNLLSLKDVEFFCFIEKSKNIVIDVSNGMRL